MNAQQNIASSVLDALLAEPASEFTATELAKLACITSSEAKAAAQSLVNEGSAKKVGRYRFQVILDEPADEPTVELEPASVEPDVDTSEADVAPVEAEPAVKPAAKRRTASHFVAKTAFEIGCDIADEQGLDADARAEFVTETMRKALTAVENDAPGTAAKVIKKALAKLAGYSSEFDQYLRALSGEFPSASRGGGGRRAGYIRGKETQPNPRTGGRGTHKSPYIHVNLRSDISTPGEQWTAVERIVNGRMQIVMELQGVEFDDDGTRRSPMPSDG